MDILSERDNGVTIKVTHYNVYSYADDILFSSTSITGLQKLIDKASSYIQKNGLQFNHLKTSCMIYGKNPFVRPPEWNLDREKLNLRDSITYLGAEISHQGGVTHTQERVRSVRRAFYSLHIQGAGLRWNGVSPYTSKEIFSTGVNSVLTYGCASLSMNKSNLSDLDKIQSKLMKASLGLPSCCRRTPLPQALNVKPVSSNIMKSSLRLLKSCLYRTSLTRKFYTNIMMQNQYYTGGKTLFDRVSCYTRSQNIDLYKYLYLFNDKYCKAMTRELKWEFLMVYVVWWIQFELF